MSLWVIVLPDHHSILRTVFTRPLLVGRDRKPDTDIESVEDWPYTHCTCLNLSYSLLGVGFKIRSPLPLHSPSFRLNPAAHAHLYPPEKFSHISLGLQTSWEVHSSISNVSNSKSLVKDLDCLTDWLTDCLSKLNDFLPVCLSNWLRNCLTDLLTICLTDLLIDCLLDWPTACTVLSE